MTMTTSVVLDYRHFSSDHRPAFDLTKEVMQKAFFEDAALLQLLKDLVRQDAADDNYLDDEIKR